MTKHKRSQISARKLTEVAVATPQVMAHRLTRMALSGPMLSPRDQQEFTGMVMEKQRAFVDSWTAMFGEVTRLQGAWMARGWTPSQWLNLWSPYTLFKNSSALQSAALSVANAGLAPVHRKVVSNARRLRGVKIK